MAAFSNAILVYNTKSGQSKKGEFVTRIKSHFLESGISLEFVEIPKDSENISETIDQLPLEGVDLFIAAGGDGTVSLVGSKLVHTSIPIAILPLGTGNLIAQELNIPLELEKAQALITCEQPHIASVDVIKVDDRFSINNISVGFSPRLMKETPSSEKQKFGFFAYLINFIKQFSTLHRHRFKIQYDDKTLNAHASEVLITNGKSVGFHSLKWPEKITMNDGKLDLFVIRAKTIREFFALLFSIITKRKRSDIVKHVTFSNSCRIETKNPIPVQADGDAFGETPIEISVLPGALKVIMEK